MHQNVRCCQRRADEFAAMALFRFPFATHQDNAALLRESIAEAFNPPLIVRRCLHLLVVNFSVHVTRFIIGMPAEGIAHEDIVNPVSVQCRCQSVFGKLRFVARIRRRTHVNEIRDLVQAQHLHERSDRTASVADSINGNGCLFFHNILYYHIAREKTTEKFLAILCRICYTIKTNLSTNILSNQRVKL